MIPGLLRGCAVGIAIAAAVDPAITSMRMAKPEVAVVAADPSTPPDAALADRVARALAKKFTVLRAPFGAAGGTVLVGDRLPSTLGELASPVFAVLPEREGATVALEAARAPRSAPLDGRVPITAVARVSGARGRTLVVTLRVGKLVVDRAEREIRADNETQEVPLVFIPTTIAAVPLQVVAEIAGAQQPAAADVLIDVREKRWAVLFFDPRPSWMSTFVRRTIERDPRFIVTSRVISAPNVTTDAGRPPATLDDLAEMAMFDAILVGAPEALSDRDVAGLDAYLRRRAGSVVLLFDQRASGAYESLTNVAQWAGKDGTALPVNAITRESGRLRASEVSWPTPLPAGAEPLALDSVGRPAIWRSAVGAGRLVVSGALDAWRFRDPAMSSFERFWQTLIAETADAAAPAIDVTLANSLVEPGEPTDITVTLRDAALADSSDPRPVAAGVTATIESPAGRTSLRLWPAGPGQFQGSFRAPSAPGSYRIVVSSNGAQADAPMVVATSVSRAAPEEHEVVRAWVASRGGSGVSAAQLHEIPAALTRALRPIPRRATWYPMRSAWWIVPFALALGAEWWWRRRRGLA